MIRCPDITERRLRPWLARVLLSAVAAFWMPGAVVAQDDGPGAVALRRLAEQALADRYPADAYRLRVRVKRIAGTVEEAAGLRLEWPAEDRLPRGTTQVKLFAGNDEAGWQKAGWALLYVTHYDSVIVAGTALAAGDEVTPADGSVAWMETTAFRDAPLTPAAWRTLFQDGPVFAARSLPKGRVLRPDNLRPAYAAETGAIVVMRFERSGFQMELPCKARQAGYVDDEIRLYSTDTGKMYRARLTGPGAATWIETL